MRRPWLLLGVYVFLHPLDSEELDFSLQLGPRKHFELYDSSCDTVVEGVVDSAMSELY